MSSEEIRIKALEYVLHLARLDPDARNTVLKADTVANREIDSLLKRVREAGSTFIGDYGARPNARALDG